MNKNLTILKAFARKLANCRFKMAANDLIAGFKGGQYGYDAIDGEDNVVINESVFADSVSTAIAHIGRAFKDAHVFLKKEEVIQNVAVASHIDNETLRMNYKDSKLWKIKALDASPECVHAFVYEDDFAIYENQFLSYLIDVMFETLTKRVNLMKNTITTLTDAIGSDKAKGLTRNAFIEKQNQSKTALLACDDSKVAVFNSYLKSRKRLIQLKQHPIYMACKKKGDFNVVDLKPTNILIADKQYHYCYNFYLNYWRYDADVMSEEKMYQSFVAMQFLFALDKLGFSAEGQDVYLGQSGQVEFQNIILKKGAFEVVLNRNTDEALSCRVVNTVSGSTADYPIAIFHSSQLVKFTSLDARLDIAKMYNPDAYRTLLITDYASENEDVIQIVPVRANVTDVLAETISTFMLCVEGSTEVYARVCPLCGGTLVSQTEHDHSCSACQARYNLYDFEGREWIWIKRFSDVEEAPEQKQMECVTEMPVQDVLLTEDSVTQSLTEESAGKKRLGFFRKKNI